ncbi:MAG: ADP-ribosylglycohydrolase family protein [Pseudomonadota bacterium]
MLGAICGDIIGSVYEHENLKSKDFPLFQRACAFTDDTVLSCAVADSLIHDRPFGANIKRFYHWYPKAGYGFMFSKWAQSENEPAYNSYGNGSAMRVSPIAWVYETLDDVLNAAEKTAEVTHNHPEGIKGAKLVAGAAFLARSGGAKADIDALARSFEYDMDRRLDEIRPDYHFKATCQESVPEAVIAFLESDSFEDAIRNAVSIGGDSDTIACMTGSIAEPFYGGVPADIREQTLSFLDERLCGVFSLFEDKFMAKQK